jgi:dihydroflavonol-4-reductase
LRIENFAAEIAKMNRDLTVVTGGAGFIGSHLVGQLVDSGRLVRVVERPGAAVGHLPAGIEIVFGDIRDRPAVARAVEGGRWVYHLAANPSLWVRDRREFEEVNYRGTINVLDAALAAGAQRVLHTSTESILTKRDVRGPIDENIEITREDAVGPYCLSKLLAEQYAFSLAHAGKPVVVANPTMPVGPGDRGFSPPTRLVFDLCAGRLPAVMDCTLNLIDVRDLAHGLMVVMELGQPGRRYLLGFCNLTMTALLYLLSELAGERMPRWRIPYPVGLTVAWLSEFYADWISGRAPQATLTGVRLARRTMHFDPSRTLGELGLRPRPIRESLADSIEWLRATGYLAGRAGAIGKQ